uniref:Pept_C1 domain-containing protein n=1 Tax=Macrostomum lignano TaxID=282301 RepID=A0A1I8F7N4_9PLAT
VLNSTLRLVVAGVPPVQLDRAQAARATMRQLNYDYLLAQPASLLSRTLEAWAANDVQTFKNSRGAKRLVKLGELLVDSASDEARKKCHLEAGGPAAAKFYALNASSGTVQEVPSLKSECSGVCPNCLATSSGIVEFSPGDYYIGVIAPVRYPATAMTDSTAQMGL